MSSQHTTRTNNLTTPFSSGGRGTSRYSPYQSSPISPGFGSPSSWPSAAGSTPYQYPSAIPSPLNRKGYFNHRANTNNSNPRHNSTYSSPHRNIKSNRGRAQKWSHRSSNGRRNKRDNGPPDYRIYVKDDMVGDPWAHLPGKSIQGQPSSSALTIRTKSASTPELYQNQSPKKLSTRDVEHGIMKAHPDRQQRINKYEASGAAPPNHIGLNETSKTNEDSEMVPETSLAAQSALDTTSRLSSNKNSAAQSNISMADILSEFL